MIRTVKEGSLLRYELTGQCPYCGCVVECHTEDTVAAPGKSERVVNCPHFKCGHQITLKKLIYGT